jgi:hypothetical protein
MRAMSLGDLGVLNGTLAGMEAMLEPVVVAASRDTESSAESL